MFCGKCGTPNAEGTPFCAGCGADLGGGKPKGAPKINLKDRKSLIAVVAGAVVLVLLLVLLFGGRSATSTAKKFMNGVVDADAEAMFDLLPKKVVDYIMEEDDMDKGDWEDMLEEASEDMAEMYEQMEDYYDGKVKITYEIKDEEDLDDDDLEDLQDDYEDMDVKVKDAKIIEIKVTTKVGDEKFKETLEIVVIKVGGSWYIDMYSLMSFV